MKNGKQKMENGKWKMENGKWKMENGTMEKNRMGEIQWNNVKKKTKAFVFQFSFNLLFRSLTI